MLNVTLPYNFDPRQYQKKLYNSLADGYKRGVAVWHRRAGKDVTFCNILSKECFRRVGTYFYILPYYRQARIIIWEGITGSGRKFLDYFHPKTIKHRNNQEMVLTMVNDSKIRFLGSDNIDSIVGTNPVGVILGEYSLHKPQAWDYLSPILRENGGWGLFNYTPRGHNHGWQLYKMAKSNPNWFCEKLTVEDTFDNEGNRIITEADIEEERASGMPDATIRQEYYCSFEAGVVGAYLATYIDAVRKRGGIGAVPYDPLLPVYTAWDLGRNDANAIWFFQVYGKEIRFIDYLEGHDKSMVEWIRLVKSKPYIYEEHFAPHDIEVHEYTTNRTRWETAASHGIEFTVLPKYGLEDGIEIARSILPLSWFDEIRCNDGIECLMNYARKFDEKHNQYLDTPIKNWARNGADAFRYAAIAVSEVIETATQYQTQVRRAVGGQIRTYRNGRRLRHAA